MNIIYLEAAMTRATETPRLKHCRDPIVKTHGLSISVLSSHKM